jgi:hypothetical protein
MLIFIFQKMSKLSVLLYAIATNDTEAVRRFCQQYYFTSIDLNWFDLFKIRPMDLSKMALELNHLEIFKIVFLWSRQYRSIWFFQNAIANNKLPFVQFLFPFVQDILEHLEREGALEDTEGPGFEALHAWLEQAFHPQIAFDRWKYEWGYGLELIFTQPSLYQMETELNTLLAAGLIDEDGYPIRTC